MALALDKHVLADEAVNAHVDMALDFVGFFNDWSSDNITDCQTSSRWSECIVNTYHLCGRAVAPHGWNWWSYSKCMYLAQYPADGSAGLQCAGMNPTDPKLGPNNKNCTADEYNDIVDKYSLACASEAGIPGEDVKTCVQDGRGVALLKASFHKTTTFPKNPKGYIEPQWIQVNGPDCELTGYNGCMSSFDNTSCTTWEDCNADAWALHIRSLACSNTTDCTSPSSRQAVANALAPAL